MQAPSMPSVTMSPAQAAQQAMMQFQLLPFDVGMAPPVNAELGHRRTYVGIPNWMWSASQTSLNWGPHTQSISVGGHALTMTAHIETVTWNMGDGTVFVCGAGTPYAASYGLTASPSCGHAYATTSLKQPDGMFTTTATSNWVVTWSTTTGYSGVIRTETETTERLEVLELQSVNT